MGWVSLRRLASALDLVKDYIDSKNAAGLFTLQLDLDGNLYAVYPDGTLPPKFEYDAATGNLYYIVDD